MIRAWIAGRQQPGFWMDWMIMPAKTMRGVPKHPGAGILLT
jgi:hypothetical protein